MHSRKVEYATLQYVTGSKSWQHTAIRLTQLPASQSCHHSARRKSATTRTYQRICDVYQPLNVTKAPAEIANGGITTQNNQIASQKRQHKDLPEDSRRKTATLASQKRHKRHQPEKYDTRQSSRVAKAPPQTSTGGITTQNNQIASQKRQHRHLLEETRRLPTN